MRILITGATGFIGSELVKKAIVEGHEVHCLVRKKSDTSRLFKGSNIHYLSSENNDINNIIAKIKPDIVFHLASFFIAEHKYCDIDDLIYSNITFATKLVDAMVKNNILLLVNAGTTWQHGNSNEEYNPVNLYAATKQAFEDILKFYNDHYKLRIINLKLFDTYGENDFRKKLFWALNKAIEKKEKLEMSLGEQEIDLVHIDDVVNAFMLAGRSLIEKNEISYESYVLSSGNIVKLKELVENYEKFIGKKIDIEWGARPYREREVMKVWKHGKNLPGWEPLKSKNLFSKEKK